MNKRQTSDATPKVAVSANQANVRRKAARKQWKPRSKTRVMPYFLDENGNAFVYVDSNGKRL